MRCRSTAVHPVRNLEHFGNIGSSPSQTGLTSTRVSRAVPVAASATRIHAGAGLESVVQSGSCAIVDGVEFAIGGVGAVVVGQGAAPLAVSSVEKEHVAGAVAAGSYREC